MKHKNRILACALPLLSLSPLVYAAPNDGVQIGAFIAHAPRYSGSNDSHLQILPLVSAKMGMFFLDFHRGLGVHLDLTNHWYVEQSLGYRGTRKDSDSNWGNGSDYLKGMGKTDSAWTSTTTFGYAFNPYISADVSATTALNHDQGINYVPTISGQFPLPNQFRLIAKASWLLATHNYTQTFYGVNTTQSQQTGFARYHSAGGGYGHQLSLGLIKLIGENMTASLLVGYTHLSDKVARSDVVQDNNNLTTVLALSYRIW
ncbi:MipA/OmpV family protein [Celerinatantimonas yamalensis]|uniref:MipA/OmpV family protein n=1 Tax=Celerinatantimonas yamalensis TaxID=559956 RepID=A0ABW9G4Z3_9GAMM